MALQKIKTKSSGTKLPNNLNILTGDCRVLLKKLDSNLAHLVLTDPPYFIDGMDDSWNNSKLQNKTKNAKIIGGLPVGMKFDKKQGIRLQKFITPIAAQLFRILKPGGFVLCFSAPRLVHRMAMSFEDSGFEIRDILAWSYRGQPKAFSQDHFVKKRNIPYEEKQKIIEKLAGRKTAQLAPMMEPIILAQKPTQGTLVDNWLKYETGLIDPKNPIIEPHKFPGTVIPASKPEQKYGHIAVKPTKLLEHLIRIFSVQNGLVLDPFAGTGTTGIACINAQRKFIGMDIDQEITKIAKERILKRYLDKKVI